MTEISTTHLPDPARDTIARRVARGLLVAFYGIAGVMHLIASDAMTRIVPPWVPRAHDVVLGTGLAEMIGAAALLTTRWRVTAGWAFAAYAVCVYPANVQHALLDLSRGTGLSGWYHYPRLALQPVIVWWALWASGAVDWPWRGRRARVVTPDLF